jgi:methionyl aminopeptidase
MTIETEEDLARLRAIGRIVASCMQHMAERMEAGMTTAELDAIGAAYLELHGARSAPQVMYDFPGATCISINEEVAHGVPGDRVIQPGDLVNIDVSAEKDGYFGDTGGSFPIGEPTKKQRRVCTATRQALHAAMRVAKAGAPLNEIGRAIERVGKKHRLKSIKDLCSHGIGRSLHEEPESIYGYYEPRDPRHLAKGMVITIEPFLTTGPRHVTEADDGWTLLSSRGAVTAQYEHTMVITDGAPEILTRAA